MTTGFEEWYAKQMRDLAKKEKRPLRFTWSAPRPISDEVLDGAKADALAFLRGRWASQRQIRMATKRTSGAVGLALRELCSDGAVETKTEMNGRYRLTLYKASPASGASEPAAPGQAKGDPDPVRLKRGTLLPRQQSPVASPAAGAQGGAA